MTLESRVTGPTHASLPHDDIRHLFGHSKVFKRLSPEQQIAILGQVDLLGATIQEVYRDRQNNARSIHEAHNVFDEECGLRDLVEKSFRQPVKKRVAEATALLVECGVPQEKAVNVLRYGFTRMWPVVLSGVRSLREYNRMMAARRVKEEWVEEVDFLWPVGILRLSRLEK